MNSLSAIVLACCLLGASAQVPGAQPGVPAPLTRQDVSLQPFTQVQLCAPISTLILPNATGGFGLTIEAEPAVLPVLSYTVVDGVLRLETTGDFSTARPIKLTVTLPADQLQTVTHQGAGAEVFVGGGFAPPSFTATTAFGAGRLYVYAMQSPAVTVTLSSSGDVVLDGSFGTVAATTTGTGSVYIAGVTGSVALDMQGVSDAFVLPAAPTVAITGRAQGLNSVQYTTGTCSVESTLGLFTVCQQAAFIAFPPPNPVWSCGIAAKGAFACSAEGAAFTSAGGVDTTSGGVGSFPTQAVGGAVVGPGSFQWAGATPTGSAQQAGAVTPGGTTAAAGAAGTGSVSSSAVAGPGGATTSTTQGGQTATFQTTGQGTVGAVPGSTPASSSSTAFASATSSATATATGTGGTTTTTGGVIRVGPGGAQAAATSQACQAYPLELSMPVS